jgi:hypothetical protein
MSPVNRLLSKDREVEGVKLQQILVLEGRVSTRRYN